MEQNSFLIYDVVGLSRLKQATHFRSQTHDDNDNDDDDGNDDDDDKH